MSHSVHFTPKFTASAYTDVLEGGTASGTASGTKSETPTGSGRSNHYLQQSLNINMVQTVSS